MSGEILILPAQPADRRIAYGDEPDQFFDLRLPEARGAKTQHPLVINVHGGFWRAQYDLAHAGHLCAALTKRGIATANLEYRRVGNSGGGWPGTFTDICAAYAFLLKHAETYHIDARKILVMGHSAGGQLALCLAAREVSILAVLCLAGVVDLRRAYELHLSRDAVVEFLGGTPSEVPHRYHDADPMQRPVTVPQFLFHGFADDEVPIDFSRAYAAYKKKQNENVQFISIPGAGHYELIDPRTPAWKQIEETVLRILQ